jgi:predicted permease
MSFWSRLARTLRAERRDRHEDEVREELEFHLAMKARDGAGPREARLRFGPRDAIRDETRAAGIVQWLESLLQDARYGVRQLRQTPVIALAVVASLTIGIGANTAIFGLVDAALLKPLPVPDPQSLVVLNWATQRGTPRAILFNHLGATNSDAAEHGRTTGSSIAPRIYRQLARQQTSVAALIGFTDGDDVGVAGGDRPAEQVRLQYVSDNFFQGLGVPLRAGRPFLPEDDRIGQEPAVVISHRFWRRQFGAREDALDRPLRINGVLTRVVGIIGPEFFGTTIGEWTDLYVPLAARVALNPRVRTNADFRGEPDNYWWVQLMARLRPDGYAAIATPASATPPISTPTSALTGAASVMPAAPASATSAVTASVTPAATAATARDQLSLLFQRLVVPDGVTLPDGQLPTLEMRPGARGPGGLPPNAQQALWMLSLLVGLVLLIVCANVANLLLSRAAARQREAAVRLALGAGRWRVLRQHLVESLVLAVVGGGLGLGLGYLLAGSIYAIFRSGMDLGLDLQIDMRLIAYAAAISFLTALVFGIAPAFQFARADFSSTLNMNSRSVFAGRQRLARALVIVEIALCLTVLVAAGLLGRSLANLKQVDVGFAREQIIYASVNPWRAGYDADQVVAYVDRAREALGRMPGALRVGFMRSRLLGGPSSSTIPNIPGRPFTMNRADMVLMNGISDDMVDTLGLRVIAGRAIDARDLHAQPDAAMIDETFAQRFFPNQNPVGRRFGLGPQPQGKGYEIVGVIKPVRYANLREAMRPTMYLAWPPRENAGRDIHFVVRTAVDPRLMTETILRTLAGVDPNVTVDGVHTQAALIDGLLRTERLLSVLSNAFGAIALILAGVGLAGLLVYSVTRRTQEIGVRMALGAAPGAVAKMVLGDSARLVTAGVVVGLPCAYAVARLLSSTLFDLQPADPTTAAVALATLTAVAALAAGLPARRAARIDPIAALRSD